MNQPSILVVASEDRERRNISAWLEDAGYTDVMFCPGPANPDYVCLGGKGAVCPLSKAADIVVVDLRLRSDEVMLGTPAWQLMLYYYDQGKKVVAISGIGDAVHPWEDEQLVVVARPLEKATFLQAIRSFAPRALTV